MEIYLRTRTENTAGVFGTCEQYAAALAEKGVKVAGIVDKGSTAGFVEWQKACRAHGIRALFGCEWFVNFYGVKQEYMRRAENYRATTAIWCLAKNQRGVQQIYTLNSKATDSALDFTDLEILKDCWIFTFNEYLVTNFRFIFGAECVVGAAPNANFVWAGENEIPSADFQQAAAVQGIKTDAVLCDYENTPLEYEIAAQADFDLPRAVLRQTERGMLAERILRAADAFLKKSNRYALPEQKTALLKRLDAELITIETKGFDDYFLLIADLIEYAKGQGIKIGIGRGSAAGSMVCYVLGITECDPMQYGLLFERFLAPDRTDLPDVDIDVESRRRGELFEWLARRGHTARIATKQSVQLKTAVGKVRQYFDLGFEKVKIFDALKESRPNITAKELKETPEYRLFSESEPQAAACIANLLGAKNASGMHAAGIVVSDEPLTNFASVRDGVLQADKKGVETANLIKIDLLGLSTLDALADCERAAGIESRLYTCPTDDAKTFDLLKKGFLAGIFQLEGRAAAACAKAVHIETLADLMAVVALARPAPMANDAHKKYGWAKYHLRGGTDFEKSGNAAVDAVLQETFGVILYQEQVLKIFEIFGFDATERSQVRKIISKNTPENLAPFKEKFLTNAKGFDAYALWKKLEKSALWLMCKAHVLAYSLTALYCAYLKAHYPLHFYAGMLNATADVEKQKTIILELRQRGFDFTPFDVQKSRAGWAVIDGELVGGFQNLRGVGLTTAQKLENATDAERAKYAGYEPTISKADFLSEKYAEKYTDGVYKIRAFLQGANGKKLKWIARIMRANAKENKTTLCLRDDTGEFWAEYNPRFKTPENYNKTRAELLPERTAFFSGAIVRMADGKPYAFIDAVEILERAKDEPAPILDAPAFVCDTLDTTT